MSVVYGAHDDDYLVFEYSGPLGHVVLSNCTSICSRLNSNYKVR